MIDLSFNHEETVEMVRLFLFENDLSGSFFGKPMTNSQIRRALFEMEDQHLLLTYYIEDNCIHIYK